MKNTIQSKWRREDFQRLRTLEYIPKGHIDFVESIAEAHCRAKDFLAGDAIYPHLSIEKAQEMLSLGFPLLTIDRMSIRSEGLRAHLEEICHILSKYRGLDSNQIEVLVKSEEQKNLDLKELIRKTLFHDSDYLRGVSEKLSLDENILIFIAFTLARPLFELAAYEMRDMLIEFPWWKNICPACGSDPFMARMRREDGMRILRCSLCSTEWKFARVKCPFCKNEEPKSLKFFYYQEESPYRLYVCDQCKRYIKCVDERKIDQTRRIDLSVEDMVTLYLDALAREKGYLSPSISQDADSQGLTSG